MKKIFLMLALLPLVTGCNAQHKQHETSATSPTDKNKPQVNWEVNKKYDDKGNLIRYDSTYTWTYSNNGKVQQVDADSVMSEFKQQFNTGFPSLFRNDFGNPVWEDSLFYRDFTSPDYFMQKWEQHYFDMSKIMRQMDSARNSFLKNKYPGLESKVNTPKG